MLRPGAFITRSIGCMIDAKMNSYHLSIRIVSHCFPTLENIKVNFENSH